MGSVAQLKRFLDEQGADSALVDLLPSLQALLPNNVEFENDQWDLILWHPRRGNKKTYYVYFDKIINHDLKLLAKLYILEKRQAKQVVAGTIKAILPSIVILGRALGARPLKKLSNTVFMDAQELIVAEANETAAPRMAGYLEAFGRWLTINLGYRISYTCTLTSRYQHGRKASDKERDAKLVDSRIVADLIAANQRDDLSIKDRFYLSSFVILAGTGFRINELATLPKDCIIKEGDNVGIRFYPEKRPRLDTRWLPTEWVSAVEEAISILVEITKHGREVAAQLRPDPGLDWSAIFRDEEAAKYFVQKFCHEWTANPIHHMFNNEGAWFEKEKRYVDAIKLVDDAGSQVKAAKQLGVGRQTISNLLKAQNAALSNELPPTAKSGGKKERTSWDTDSRVVSIMRLEKYSDLALKPKSREYFAHIIEDARNNYQLEGGVYPCPPHNADLEERFRRVIHPLIASKDGLPLLQPEEALLITSKYQLTDARGTKLANFQLIDDKALIRWFAGENRSHGTKNAEDSCFSRLEIVDPKTGEIAKFTSHDIRHWLTTYYLEGGMPSDQVAQLFNRAPGQNDAYDQTSSKTRLNNMREAILDGGAIGHVSDVYHEIAEYSREEAEQYLQACTLQLNLMPHGGCSLNWGMSACPYHNGCFNDQDGICEHLCIDLTEQDTLIELTRLKQETSTALSIIPEESPQFVHYANILRNLSTLIEDDKHD